MTELIKLKSMVPPLHGVPGQNLLGSFLGQVLMSTKCKPTDWKTKYLFKVHRVSENNNHQEKERLVITCRIINDSIWRKNRVEPQWSFTCPAPVCHLSGTSLSLVCHLSIICLSPVYQLFVSCPSSVHTCFEVFIEVSFEDFNRA